jgi:imidazolonepropionase
MDLLIRNIKELFQVTPGNKRIHGANMKNIPSVKNAYLYLKDGLISDFGDDGGCEISAQQTIDAKGGMVLPAFVDCHTHLVFPASREEEFVMKIKGVSYAEIARMGGGIQNSASKLRLLTEDELFEASLPRLHEAMCHGTGAIEIKSGYGLDTVSELKMLRVARRLGKHMGIPVRTTFLGAHTVPKGFGKSDYIRLVIDEMIPAVASEKLADYIDVFCETGFFTYDESVEILMAGRKYGMTPRVHANQLSNSGGIEAGIFTNAISVDHLECAGDKEIELLKSSQVMPVALPGAAFFLRADYPPVRKIIDAELPLVVASDYNPGSSPSANMFTMWSLACIGMRLTPEEALNSVTINAAAALEIESTHGSIERGKSGSVIITKPIPSLAYIPYHFGMDITDTVVVNGKIFYRRNS